MLDSYNREITYLRISVTDRCNLRCLYCMPPEGIPQKAHSECLSFEEITAIAREAAELGITKIRLTGGEPLVRSGIVKLVGMLREIPNIKVIGMTTNGHFLDRYADPLKEAGLDSLNISLDTLNGERYSRLTRGGDIRKVLEGIEAALAAGFPLKLNMVATEDTTEQEILEMQEFCQRKGIKLQKIREYSLKSHKEENDDFLYHRPPPCGGCNRIRLLSDGRLKPCLHSDKEILINMNEISQSIKETIENKPRCGSVCHTRKMVEIGG